MSVTVPEEPTPPAKKAVPQRVKKPKRADFDTDGEYRAALKKWQNQQTNRRNAPPTPDTLDFELLGEEGVFIQRLVQEIPEIRNIFEEAANNGWFNPGNNVGLEKFKNQIIDSNWYKSTNEYFREAWQQQRLDPGTFGMRLERARRRVVQLASAAGAQLNAEDTEILANRFVFEGWERAENDVFLREAISEKIEFGTTPSGQRGLTGGAGSLAETLKGIAQSNGLTLTDDYYLSAARSVASGLTSEEDWLRDIREQAASRWPNFADKIRGGSNVKDLASAYMYMMQQELGVPFDSISLDDPYMMQAFGGMDENGNPRVMSLFDFRKMLRQDPRWLETPTAQNEIAGASNAILKMFGIVG